MKRNTQRNDADTGAKARAYEVLKGLSYYDNKARGEVGDIVTDLPAESIPWLLEQGCIKPVEVKVNVIHTRPAD